MPHLPNHQLVQSVGQDRPVDEAIEAYDASTGKYEDNVDGKKPAPAMREPNQTPRFVTTG